MNDTLGPNRQAPTNPNIRCFRGQTSIELITITHTHTTSNLSWLCWHDMLQMLVKMYKAIIQSAAIQLNERVYRKHGQGFQSTPELLSLISKTKQKPTTVSLGMSTSPHSSSFTLIAVHPHVLTSLPKTSSYPVKQSSLWSGHLTNKSILATLQSSQASNSSILGVKETRSPSLWIPRASATQLSAHYKPGPVLKIPLEL